VLNTNPKVEFVFLTIMGIYLFLLKCVIEISKLHPEFLVLEVIFSVLSFEQVTCNPICHCSHCNFFANSFDFFASQPIVVLRQ
jgi:hypothetical protein